MSVVVMTIAAVAGSASAIARADVRARAPRWVGPSAQAKVTNPLAGRRDIVAGGSKVFRDRCAQCHASDGTGTDRAPDLTQPNVHGQTDGALFWKISSGNARAG